MSKRVTMRCPDCSAPCEVAEGAEIYWWECPACGWESGLECYNGALDSVRPIYISRQEDEDVTRNLPPITAVRAVEKGKAPR